MKRSREPFDDLIRIVCVLLQELQMALQHLEHAQKPTCQPADLRYFLSWCRRHIENAKFLLDKLRRGTGSV